MAKLRMAHTSTHGARKPPGPTNFENVVNLSLSFFHSCFVLLAVVHSGLGALIFTSVSWCALFISVVSHFVTFEA